MTRLRTLIGSDGPDLSDPHGKMSRADFVQVVRRIREQIEVGEPAGRRFCLPLDSSLGALATLLAVLETDVSAALIPRPVADSPADWPAFCDALILPPDLAAGANTAEIRPLSGSDAPSGEDRVYLRTSGTTGVPKWAVHSKDGLIANGQACVARLNLVAEDRVMIPVPLYHMYGLGAALLPSLLVGAAICLVPRGNPLEVLKAQRAFEPTVMFLVPSQCRSLMALNRSAGSARLNVVAGDRLAAYEAAAFEEDHGSIVCLYGTTELGAIAAGRPDDPSDMRQVTAGRPMDGVTMDLSGEPPEDAAEGARPMRVRHPAGFLGYADPSDGHITSPAPEVWATGDLVRLHPGDYIEVLGRVDHAVKRDGLFVHMGEIEACLTRADGVSQAAVVAAGQTRRGAGLTAFCALERGGASTDEAILQHCREALPPRAVPDKLVILDALPMLASGKVDRRRLAADATELWQN